MRAKRKATLPRVTVMAYRRQDLVAFVQAVETLRLLVQDLRTIAEGMRSNGARRGRKPTTPADVADQLKAVDAAIAAAVEGGVA